MAQVEYKCDKSGSLMAQIQALIAPLDGDEPQFKPEHPYFKRPGRGHNRDVCDACGEGGDLICCDKCPASFHLQCHDPPLELEDIPKGEWLCHSCIFAKEQEKEVSESGGTPQTRSKRSASVPTTSPTKPLKKPKLKPMEVLVQAAKALNPKQFELPRSMSVPCIFPGTDKVEHPYSRGFRKQPIKSLQQTIEKWTPGAIIQLPANKCHECRKSCRVAPLISCDYCPLMFHMDCLNPPLTAPPSGRWMCPNHVEHALDTKLLTSVSITERVKLWDRYTGPVDQDAVKLEFFRKVHRKNPPFRFKVRLPPRRRVRVPPMVRHHYSKPVELLPTLRDALRLAIFEQNAGMRVDDEFIKSCSADGVEAVGCSGAKIEEGFVVNGVNGEEFKGMEGVEAEGEEFVANGVVKGEEFWNGLDAVKVESYLPDVITDVTSEVERELKQLDDRLLKLLAYQRVQQLLVQRGAGGGYLRGASPLTVAGSSTTPQHQQSRPKYMPLPSELLTPADIDRISRVFSSPKRRSRLRSNVRARAMLCPVVSKHFYNVRTSEVDPADVRHDASYMGYRPTVSARFPEAAAMRYRIISIGRGAANDVELDRYGHCNYVSPKHAVIFFDEFTKHYELINYSCYGTYVNNILYSNDLSTERTVVGGSGDGKKNSVPLETQVRDLIDKKRKVSRSTRKSSFDGKMAALDCLDRTECLCANSGTEDLKGGWEGPAVLSHGALLRFGCVSFVFSIVDCASV